MGKNGRRGEGALHALLSFLRSLVVKPDLHQKGKLQEARTENMQGGFSSFYKFGRGQINLGGGGGGGGPSNKKKMLHKNLVPCPLLTVLKGSQVEEKKNKNLGAISSACFRETRGERKERNTPFRYQTGKKKKKQVKLNGSAGSFGTGSASQKRERAKKRGKKKLNSGG